MKINFISAHQMVGPLRKSWGLSDGSSRSYPNAGKLTSYEAEVEQSAGGLREYRELLAKHAKQGHALYKGLFTRPLVNETRKGMTDKDARTQLLVLDIDGLEVPGFRKGEATADDVRNVAEHVVGLLPADLHDVSYVAVGSSSFGMKDRYVSVHLHFMLEDEVSHVYLKSWLESLNYTQDAIYEKLTLTTSKMGVKNIVDVCLAEPGRIVYIAPPYFGPKKQNPFSNDDDRIVLVEKGTPTLDLREQLSKLNDKSAIVGQRKTKKLTELQKAEGISTRKRKFESFHVGGDEYKVLADPEQMLMELSHYDDEYVRYNVNGGESGAWWVRRDNPEIVFCFKPDEAPFLFKEAAPEVYRAHIERFGKAYSIEEAEDGTVRKVTRSVFIDQTSDLYYTLEYDADNDFVVELSARRGIDICEHWLKFYGLPVPDPIPPIYIVMDTSTTQTLSTRGDKTYLNRFTPPQYMVESNPHPFDGIACYGNAWLCSVHTPLIAELMLHMLGDDLECFEHFVNWFAFIFQKRDKARTAWMVHGTEGTGKGLFFKRIVRPLFGQYCRQPTLQQIADDQFNGWMEDVLFLMIDEFNLKGAASSVVKTANTLKNLVTESTFQMRKMQTEQKEVTQRLNFFMGTNDLDAMSSVDRRRYNIAPRQKRMLDTRIEIVNEQEAEFDRLLQDELQIFSDYLHCFNVDEEKVRKIILNEARVEAQQAGMSSAAKFFDNVKEGAFEAFAELLDKPETNLPEKEFAALKAVKSVVRAVLPHVNTGEPCYMLKDHLRMIYSYLAGNQVSENYFGRMLISEDVIVKRKANPVGVTGKMVTRPPCVEVTWQYQDLEALRSLRNNNVVHINTAGNTQERENPAPINSTW